MGDAANANLTWKLDDIVEVTDTPDGTVTDSSFSYIDIDSKVWVSDVRVFDETGSEVDPANVVVEFEHLQAPDSRMTTVVRDNGDGTTLIRVADSATAGSSGSTGHSTRVNISVADGLIGGVAFEEFRNLTWAGDAVRLEANRDVTVAEQPELSIAKSASASTAQPGDTVDYTVTAENPTGVDFTGAVIADDLTGVLDDADYNDDAADGGAEGAFAFADPTLTWTGDIAAGETVTLTYSVTVHDPPDGDLSMDNLVVGPTESNCAPGSDDPACSTTVDVTTGEPVECAEGNVARAVDGVAQAWTPDSSVQNFPGNFPMSAINAPDGSGVQLWSAEGNQLTLDLATEVPGGNSLELYLAQASSNFSGPVTVSSSVDGVTFGGETTVTPTSVNPTFDAAEYPVPEGGARFVRLTPQVVDGADSAVRVDAITYTYEYCECEETVNNVVDGGFEAFEECSLQTGTYGAWTVIEDSNHIWGRNCVLGWPSPEGVNSVDLDGGTTGGAMQTVDGLTPGNEYNLTFYMAFNPAANAQSSSMRVTVGDFDETYTSAANAIDGNFNLVHAVFTATGESEVLRIESLTGSGDPLLLNGGGTPGYGVVLDDIRITPVDCSELRELAIAKTAAPTESVLPGDTVDYTVTVENTGSVA
ncbi:DUF7927 domain-containing protein [Salininema proteolyticum]|uniref:DUF642 domain-containing protein n=1 Tax=Salininema proteolyticum TaxID=1607685 RepID=A0ABV8U2V4_9ACTN